MWSTEDSGFRVYRSHSGGKSWILVAAMVS